MRFYPFLSLRRSSLRASALSLALRGNPCRCSATLSPSRWLNPFPPFKGLLFFAAFLAWYSLIKRELPCYFPPLLPVARLPLVSQLFARCPSAIPSFDRTPPLIFFVTLATFACPFGNLALCCGLQQKTLLSIAVEKGFCSFVFGLHSPQPIQTIVLVLYGIFFYLSSVF